MKNADTHSQNPPLAGQVALVTGAARGIGAAIARALAAAGADLVVVDRANEDQAALTCAAIADLGRRAVHRRADVTDEAAVADLFETVRRDFGRLDILVNNAGIVRHEDIFSTTLDSWRSVLDSHLTSTFLCSRAAMGLMCGRKRGRIIQISSVVAHQGARYGFVHYATAKAGLLGFTRTLARTAAPHGITVNAIAPGVVDSDMLRATHDAGALEMLAADIPLGISTPEEIGAAAVFLAGDGAARITGAVLDVNGGLCFH